MDIALDVESVIADSHEAVYRSVDSLSYSDMYDTWKFDSDTWQKYVGASDAIWRHKPEIIAPEEPNIGAYVDEWREEHTVDILTARLHVDEQIIWWLEEHDIQYDGFESTDVPKYEYDYDVWIDDNPEMFNECRLLLRHQPWNEHLDDEDSKMTDRIHSLGEASQFL
jgi:hypothetical protein